MWDTLKQYGKELAAEWEQDNVSSLAAALAYYATFSLVPSILVLVAIGGMLLNEADVQARVLEEVDRWLGVVAADLAREALAGSKPASARMASIVGAVAVISGATQLFAQLQDALNRVWEVRPKGKGILVMLKRRALAFGIILLFGALLLVSFMAGAVLAVVNQLFGGYGLWELVVFGSTFAIGMTTFALIFKYFPAVKLEFRDVWLGAALTTVALMASQSLFALYLSRASIASTYGAAGTLIAFLLWVYISAHVVLLGAEFTQVHARLQGREIALDEDAERRF